MLCYPNVREAIGLYDDKHYHRIIPFYWIHKIKTTSTPRKTYLLNTYFINIRWWLLYVHPLIWLHVQTNLCLLFIWSWTCVQVFSFIWMDKIMTKRIVFEFFFLQPMRSTIIIVAQLYKLSKWAYLRFMF